MWCCRTHTKNYVFSAFVFFSWAFLQVFFFSNIERYSTLFVLKCQKTGLKLLDYQELFSRCTRNQLKEFLICISICTVRLYEFHLLRVVVQALHIKLAVEYNDVIVIAISMCWSLFFLHTLKFSFYFIFTLSHGVSRIFLQFCERSYLQASKNEKCASAE